MKRGLGIDLGTANTLVYYRGVGVVIDEPSVVAMDASGGGILSAGEEAAQMIGRTPDSIHMVRPLKDGVIADYQAAGAMLEYFIHKVIKQPYLFKPDLVICIPNGVTEVEKRALISLALKAGSNDKGTYLIEEPMACAIGADLDVMQPKGSMVVDIGGGTTEIAVLSLGGTVCARSLRIAGDSIDEAIDQYIRKAFGILIGERTAEQVKINIGSCYVNDSTVEEKMLIKGQDARTGKPVSAWITNFQTAEAIYNQVKKMIEALMQTLEETPPELSADIYESGIVLCGGGAMLRGLDTMIEKSTGLKVQIAQDPLECVIHGIGKVLDDPSAYRHVLTQAKASRLG